MHPDALAARLACILLGYLFGSFLTAEVVARVVSGKSARQLGTGNPGMANIMAQLGKGAGLLTLAGDTLKTVAACERCSKACPKTEDTKRAKCRLPQPPCRRGTLPMRDSYGPALRPPRHYHGLMRIRQGTEPRFFQRRNPK